MEEKRQPTQGTNMSMSFDLLKRNGGLDDHATMLRLGAGKRWEYSRHNHVLCKACLGDFRGLRHPLLQCPNLQMGVARKRWKEDCDKYISKAKPEKLRPMMREILHHCVADEGGEFAGMGTFTEKWAMQMEDGRKLNEYELRWIKKVLRVIVSGARGVMREYARLKEVSEGDAIELRQTSIVQFARESSAAGPKENKKRKFERGESGHPVSRFGLVEVDRVLINWAGVLVVAS